MARRGKIKKRADVWIGFDGQREIVVTAVDAAYRRGEYEEVAKNIRESGLSYMLAHGNIDQAQYRAGDWYRTRREMTQGAVDPSNEPVDVSGLSDPISSRILLAGMEVARLKKLLPEVKWGLIELICVKNFTIQEATYAGFKLCNRYNRGVTGRLFREGLNMMAVELGYATKKRLT